MHQAFVELVYSSNPKESYTAFVERWLPTQPRFVSYVQTQWGPTMDKWALRLRSVPMQGVHTNNFIESWHWNLKYHFLNRTSRLRADEFIHTLVFDVVPDFRQTIMATQLGFRGQTHTKFQGIAKGQADTYSDSDLNDLGINVWPETNNQASAQPFPFISISYSFISLISVQSRFLHYTLQEIVLHQCHVRATTAHRHRQQLLVRILHQKPFSM